MLNGGLIIGEHVTSGEICFNSGAKGTSDFPPTLIRLVVLAS